MNIYDKDNINKIIFELLNMFKFILENCLKDENERMEVYSEAILNLSRDLKMMLATDDATPIEILKILMKDKDKEIRKAASKDVDTNIFLEK